MNKMLLTGLLLLPSIYADSAETFLAIKFSAELDQDTDPQEAAKLFRRIHHPEVWDFSVLEDEGPLQITG